MMRFLTAFFLALGLAVGAKPAAAVECGYNFTNCQSPFTVNGLSTELYASAPLRAAHPEIRRVLVIIHGSDANVRNYFSVGLRAAADSGKEAETLVIAPLFFETSDRSGIDQTRLTWDSNSNWRAGDLSTTAIKTRVSSFAVMDEILLPLADKSLFPNLKAIVMAGHSAGGQFVQRYALARRDTPGMASISYVVANPSSVAYLDGRRPLPGSTTQFAIPEPSSCNINQQGYGMENPNSYLKRDSAEVSITRYRARKVTYLAGDQDNSPNGAGLSKTCMAMAQGPTRFMRLTAFANYMKEFYAPNNHSYAVVPGVGHDYARMLLSPPGMAAMFSD